MLITGSTYEGGLNDFFVNTSKDYSLLAAMLSGFFVSGIVSFVVSLCTHNIRTNEDVTNEWAKTISIDNPINPYRLVYEEELATAKIDNIITVTTMETLFKKAKLYAYVGSAGSTFLCLIVLPAIALSYGVLDFNTFSTWFTVFQYYCFVCTVIVIVVPPIEECVAIIKKIQKNKAENRKHEVELNT